MDQRVGFIGLGNMGMPMAINLARAGVPLCVHDLRPEPLAELAALGAEIVQSPQEVGERSDLVATVVVDDAQVEGVLLGSDDDPGVLATARPGTILLIHSTVSPKTCERIGAAAAERSVRVLDAAVSGAEERSRAGTLTLMVGGGPEDVAACQPYFDIVGEETFHLGALGRGMAAKICNNLMVLANMRVVGEALRLATAAGVDEAQMIEIASQSTGDSWALRNVLTMREMIQRHPQGKQGAGAVGTKDLQLAIALGRELSVDVPAAELFGNGAWVFA